MQVMEKINNDELLLKSFFDENKTEIADNGFSKKVLKQIPETPNHEWIVWVFAAFGAAISLLLGYYTGVFATTLTYIQQIPFYYLAGIVFCFPLVAMLAVCSQQKCRFRVA